jgi:hypothetical protein
MRFLPPDDDVKLYTTVFEDNLLGRERASKRLSDLVEGIEDPLVIALDGRWGTGKSYFLKRWVAAHSLTNDGKGLTVYFDAFANDYHSDPLVGLIGTLANRSPSEDHSKVNRIKEVASKLIKPAVRLALALGTYGATEALNRLGDIAANTMADEAGNAMNDFWKKEEGRQAAMIEFRSAIEELTKSGDVEVTRPLIIVIDELDRCRPDYALEVLEVIKHFFSVPHVHFVLGVNLIALENSVKARYGAEIEATSYLQKFLSFTMTLPDHIGDSGQTPSVVKYAQHIGPKMEIQSDLLKEVIKQLTILDKCNKISIRDVGKIMSAVSLLPEESKGNGIRRIYKNIAISLIITRAIRPDLLDGFVSASVSDAKLENYMGATVMLAQRFLEDGESNPAYKQEIHQLRDTWAFLRLNGKRQGGQGIVSAELFGEVWGEDGYRKIPKRLFDDWLSDFSLPSPSP